MNLNDYVSVAEAAEATGYSVEWLRKLVALGQIQSERIPGRGAWGKVLILKSELPRLKQMREESRRGRPRGLTKS